MKQVNRELQIALSRLASQELQEKYCIHGTADKYLLPEELLESAANWAESAIKQGGLSVSESSAISQFLEEVNESVNLMPSANCSITPEDLILNNPGWNRVRNAAANCLKDLGLEIDVHMT